MRTKQWSLTMDEDESYKGPSKLGMIIVAVLAGAFAAEIALLVYIALNV